MILLRWFIGLCGVVLFVWLGTIPSSDLQAASPLLQLTTDPRTDVRPVWSPDGNYVAFQSNRKGSFSIWVMKADGTNQHQVTPDESNERHPAWSPDGKQLAFDSDASGSREIWVADRDGQNRRQVTFLGALSNFPAWSPDGDRISFYVYEKGIMSLWMVDIASGDTHPVAPDLADERRNQCTFACHQPAWSPDGQQIAYTGGDQRSIWVINADGSDPRELVPGKENNHFPWYTQNGEIGYLTEHVSPIEAWTDAWVVNPETGETRLLLDRIQLQGPMGWSRDGTKLLFHSPRSGNFDIYAVDLAITGGREALQTRPNLSGAPKTDSGSATIPSTSDSESTSQPAESDAQVQSEIVPEEGLVVAPPETPPAMDSSILPASEETQPVLVPEAPSAAWLNQPWLLVVIIGLAGMAALTVLGVTLYILRGSWRI